MKVFVISWDLNEIYSITDDSVQVKFKDLHILYVKFCSNWVHKQYNTLIKQSIINLLESHCKYCKHPLADANHIWKIRLHQVAEAPPLRQYIRHSLTKPQTSSLLCFRQKHASALTCSKIKQTVILWDLNKEGNSSQACCRFVVLTCPWSVRPCIEYGHI